MNECDQQNNDIERRLKQARPAGPSDEMKRQVLGEARRAWVARPSPVPWRIALRRLAISAAAAVFIVALANIWSDWAVTQSRKSGPVPVAQELDAKPRWANGESELGSGWLLGHMAIVRTPAAVDPRALLNYVQTLRDALDQAHENGSSGNES